MADTSSPTEQIHAALRAKGLPITSENVRRMLSANADDPGSQLPNLRNQAPPPADAAPKRSSGGSSSGGKVAPRPGRSDMRGERRGDEPAPSGDPPIYTGGGAKMSDGIPIDSGMDLSALLLPLIFGGGNSLVSALRSRFGGDGMPTAEYVGQAPRRPSGAMIDVPGDAIGADRMPPQLEFSTQMPTEFTDAGAPRGSVSAEMNPRGVTGSGAPAQPSPLDLAMEKAIAAPQPAPQLEAPAASGPAMRMPPPPTSGPQINVQPELSQLAPGRMAPTAPGALSPARPPALSTMPIARPAGGPLDLMNSFRMMMRGR